MVYMRVCECTSWLYFKLYINTYFLKCIMSSFMFGYTVYWVIDFDFRIHKSSMDVVFSVIQITLHVIGCETVLVVNDLHK